MGPVGVAEMADVDSDEEVLFSKSQATNEMHSLNFDTFRHISLPPKYSASWVQRRVNRVCILRSIYSVMIKPKINVLLPFGALAILLHYHTEKHGWVFFFSFLGIIPLAERLSYVTKQLTFYTSPTVDSLASTTICNTAALTVSIYELKNGMIRVVQQSILGLILSNILLVLGCAFFCGGLAHHHKVQYFNKAPLVMSSGLLLMAVMCMLFPAVLKFTHAKSEIALSRVTSCIMLFTYASYVFFQLKCRNKLYGSLDGASDNGEGLDDDDDDDDDEVPEITHWEAIGWLAVLNLYICVLSEFLVDAVQGVSNSMNVPVAFIDVILLPLIENASAIMIMMKDKHELNVTVGVAIESSVQITMLVIPLCVILGWIMGKPMVLNFPPFEIATLFITVLVMAVMLRDGQSNYFKGLMFILIYLVIAAAFFVYVDPTNDDHD